MKTAKKYPQAKKDVRQYNGAHMMSDAIKKFPTQFEYQPIIENAKYFKKAERYFYIGMGGSHLAADLTLLCNPKLPLSVSSDYELPPQTEFEKKPLVIAGSYSGNTEETINGFTLARKKRIPVVVMASGGKLLAEAKKNHLPYIQLPQTGIQPRMALGLGMRAMQKILGDEKSLRESARLAQTLQPMSLQKMAKTLAKKLSGRVPVIYSSARNLAIAYNWKIKFNETGKIPSFYNVLPELNHNEMNGFDVQPSTKQLSERFHFIFLKDTEDHPRIEKRMEILERLYRARKLPIEVQILTGKNIFEKVFTSLLIADWTAVAIAEQYGLESEQVPMVEEFKKLMQK